MTRYPRIRQHVAFPRSRTRASSAAAVPSRAPAARRRGAPRAGSALCSQVACVAALALACCGGETTYVPRTRHVLALAMKRGQPALYRDGALIEIGDAAAALHGCPPVVVSALDESADHRASARRDAVLAGLSEGLSAIALPLLAVTGALFWLSVHHEQAANADLIDALNRHNDAPECQP